jgi:ribosome-associated protein
MSSTETAAKRDIQKLQRVIIDALEDVKAIDIRVFNTEHLSPLFERVIVASGNSNRQTQALAASVRDAVREAGFDKPRSEGGEVGEWIVVDCGTAVVHVMQPAIRTYYHLEDIWGDKPVKAKLSAPKKLVKASAPEPAKAEPAKKPAAKKSSPKSAPKKAASAAKADGKPASPKSAAGAKTGSKAGSKAGVKSTTAKPAPAKKAPAKKAAPSKTAAFKSLGIKSAATATKSAAAKAPVKKAPAKKAAAKKAPVRKPVR